MFVFLSKFLPLFLYPLGLILLILTGICFWGWRQQSGVQWPALAGVMILLISGNAWVSDALIQSLEYQCLPKENLPTAPAIVVLGGGLYQASYPRQFPEVAEAGDRPIYAAQLYGEGKAPYIIATGGRIPWLGKVETSEATDMALLLQRLGVPADRIIEEGKSLNTRENGVFTKEILDRRNIKEIILVTSGYHMPRAKRVFEKLGITVIPAPTDFLSTPTESNDFNLANVILKLVPNAQSLALTTMALKEYLGLLIYTIQGWA
jgi:uncharacterized SAM-binding protein YcdF (DUF218 family)